MSRTYVRPDYISFPPTPSASTGLRSARTSQGLNRAVPMFLLRLSRRSRARFFSEPASRYAAKEKGREEGTLGRVLVMRSLTIDRLVCEVSRFDFLNVTNNDYTYVFLSRWPMSTPCVGKHPIHPHPHRMIPTDLPSELSGTFNAIAPN